LKTGGGGGIGAGMYCACANSTNAQAPNSTAQPPAKNCTGAFQSNLFVAMVFVAITASFESMSDPNDQTQSSQPQGARVTA
jgi:hypothetical protein